MLVEDVGLQNTTSRLAPPRYVQNSLSILFPQQPGIRRLANAFEDQLAGSYSPPQIIPIPDELDPQVPRLILGSEHGFSQIVVSQVSLSLNVSYSPDWQTDVARGQQYLRDRLPLLFSLLSVIGDIQPLVCGLTTVVHMSTREPDEWILSYLARLLGVERGTHPYDISQKTASVVEDTYFNNLTIENYRTWVMADVLQSITPIPAERASERGIRLVSDFNDRYAFNEGRAYATSQEAAAVIVDRALDQVRRALERIRGAH